MLYRPGIQLRHFSARFAITASVEQTSRLSLIATTAPVEITGEQFNRVSMRFFLPGALAAKGAPEPLVSGVQTSGRRRSTSPYS